MNAAKAYWINNGKRLHLQHGPIDLIIEADGAPGDCTTAYDAAVECFQPVLQELVNELGLLKSAVHSLKVMPEGVVAKRMVYAAKRVECALSTKAASKRVMMTPMIAVAGSVADEVLSAMICAAEPQRVCVNNGGDIAIHLAHGREYQVGIVTDPTAASIDATVSVRSGDGINGVATSGRHGRSLSTGIADSVTVLASSAAVADTAATLIANTVDLPGSHKIRRVPACEADPSSDLGQTLVTVDVGQLSCSEVAQALNNGAARATQLHEHQLIHAAYLHLHGCSRVITPDQLSELKPSTIIQEPEYA